MSSVNYVRIFASSLLRSMSKTVMLRKITLLYYDYPASVLMTHRWLMSVTWPGNMAEEGLATFIPMSLEVNLVCSR